MTGLELQRVTKDKGIELLEKSVKDTYIRVGILRGLGEHPKADAGQTLAEIAFWNEFGTVHIPARPFLRSTLKENRDVYKNEFKNILKAVLNRKVTGETAIGLLALRIATDIQNTITTLIDPPNSPVTIALKQGKQNPLIDSGIMRQSISWELE